MKTFVGLSIIALAATIIGVRYQAEITAFLKTTSPGTLAIAGLIGAMLIIEFGHKSPKKKKDD